MVCQQIVDLRKECCNLIQKAQGDFKKYPNNVESFLDKLPQYLQSEKGKERFFKGRGVDDRHHEILIAAITTNNINIVSNILKRGGYDDNNSMLIYRYPGESSYHLVLHATSIEMANFLLPLPLYNNNDALTVSLNYFIVSKNREFAAFLVNKGVKPPPGKEKALEKLLNSKPAPAFVPIHSRALLPLPSSLVPVVKQNDEAASPPLADGPSPPKGVPRE